MNYWLCFTSKENWKRILEENIWGVESKYSHILNEVKIDDKLLIYVYRESKIYGEFKCVSEPFNDSSSLFKGKKGYNYRIKLELIKLPKLPFDFKDTISNLSFIKNKTKWFGHLRGARCMRMISKHDYEHLESFF